MYVCTYVPQLLVGWQDYFFFRSISLVGEKERKMLKEIVKQAKQPVKSRIIAPGELYKDCQN